MFGNHRKSRDFQYCGMQKDDLLDFEGRDILATPPDGVLFPVNEIQVAIFINVTSVPGMEPQVASRSQRRLRHVVITLWKQPRCCRSHNDLAGLATRDLKIVVVDNLYLDAL